MRVAAPRIVNDVSYVTKITHATCESFCVAGAVFGEVGS